MGSTLYNKRWKWTEGRIRKKRPKTFNSEAAAKKYAETNKISNYELVNLHASAKKKKIRIVSK
jgi:hypothetical protein